MNTFDRYLLREWLGILFLVLVLTCGLLLVQVMYDSFRTLREAGAHGFDLWYYFFITMPSFLAVALPLVLLVSTLFVLGKLHRANELTAMRAAGVSFGRMMAPIWCVGLLCCALSSWLNASVVPWSVHESRQLLDELQFRKQAQSLPPDRIGVEDDIGFENPDARRIWFFNRFSQFTGKGYGVSVSELDVRRRETNRLLAAQAWYDEKRGGWIFLGGREMAFDPDTGENLASAPFREKFVARYHEDPQLMLLISLRPIDLSFLELRRMIDYFSEQNSARAVPYEVRYYGLVADTLGPLIVIAIAIPFAVAGVRVNPAVAVSKSIGLFFLYYVFETVAGSLAAKQLLDPAFAAWLPNLGMGVLGGLLFLRLR